METRSSRKSPSGSSSRPRTPRRARSSRSATSSVLRRPTTNMQREERIIFVRETVAYGFRSRTYPCTTCGKLFHSPQALGGHRNGHSRDRRLLEEYLTQVRSASNPPPPASNEVPPHDPKPAHRSAAANSNSKRKGVAHPYLSRPRSDPSPVVSNAVSLISPVPASPLGFDPKGKTVLMTSPSHKDSSPSFPSLVFDPKGKTVLETSAHPKEHSFFPDSNTAASLWNPNPAWSYLVPRPDASFVMGELPQPSGGPNSGGKVTKYLLGALEAPRGAAPGGSGCGWGGGGGQEPIPMGLDLELHL